jgi:hypothetical protein
MTIVVLMWFNLCIFVYRLEVKRPHQAKNGLQDTQNPYIAKVLRQQQSIFETRDP